MPGKCTTFFVFFFLYISSNSMQSFKKFFYSLNSFFRGALAEVTSMLQERQHRWLEMEDLCDFSIVTDSLFANLPKKSRKSSLRQALADVTSLSLSVPVVETINEGNEGTGEEVFSPSQSQLKNSRENSFDSGSSSNGSRQASVISTQSSLQENTVENNPSHTHEKTTERSTSSPSDRLRRVSSEKFGQLSESRVTERRIHRVCTEPLDMSRRAIVNVMNGRAKSNVDLRSDINDDVDASSRRISTQTTTGYMKRASSNCSLNSDSDNASEGGNISDDSLTSASSVTTKSSATTNDIKKPKKGSIRRIKKIFHRKQKEES